MRSWRSWVLAWVDTRLSENRPTGQSVFGKILLPRVAVVPGNRLERARDLADHGPARLDAPGLVDDHDAPVALGAGQVAEGHDLGVPLVRRDLVRDPAGRQGQLAEQRVGDVE